MKIFGPLPTETESLATIVVDSAYRVHSCLGPGLLESVYETCLVHELRKRGVQTETQQPLPIFYDNVRLQTELRIDVIVSRQIIVEVKAVEQMNRVFKAQLLTYLELTGIRLGCLLNFNITLIKNGIERVILRENSLLHLVPQCLCGENSQ